MPRNNSRRWLSSEVNARLRRDFSELAPPSVIRARYDRVDDFFPLKTIALVTGAWGVLVLLNERLVGAGLVIANPYVNAQNIADFFASMLEYLAVLVGITIPVILLVIQFVGRHRISVIDVYLDNTGVKRTAIGSLTLLAAVAVLTWLTRVELLVDSTRLFYWSLLALMLGIAVVYLIVNTILQVRKSLSSEFFVTSVLEVLQNHIRESFRTEVKFRLGRLAHIDLCQQLGISTDRSPIQPTKTIAVRAQKSGIIHDIDRFRFTELVQLVKKGVDETPKLTRLMGDRLSEGEIILYVDATHTDRVPELEQAITATLKIREAVSAVGEVDRLLWQVEEEARQAIERQNKPLFDGLLEVYEGIITSTIRLPSLPDIDWPMNAFREWNPASLAVQHLHALLDTAANLRNEKFLLFLFGACERIVATLIGGSGLRIDRNLPGMMNISLTVYDVSRRDNLQFKDFSRWIPTKQLSSYFLHSAMVSCIRFVHSDEGVSSKQALTNAEKVLRGIWWTIAELAKRMVAENDVKSLGYLLDDFNPERIQELFTTFDTVDWRKKTAETQAGSIEDVDGDENDILRSAERFPAEYRNFFEDLVYILYCYALEGFERGEFDAVSTGQLASILVTHMKSLQTTLEKLHKMLSQAELFGWEMFERYEKDGLTSKGLGFSSMLLLGYCLLGIQAVSSDPTRLDLKPTMISSPVLADIVRRCIQISNSAETWSQVLDVSPEKIRSGAERFAEINRDIVSQWYDRMSDIVANTELDSKVEGLLTEVVSDMLRTHDSLWRLLSPYGAVNASDHAENWDVLSVSYQDHKHFYISGDDTRARTAAEQRVQRLLRMENNYFVDRLIGLSTVVEDLAGSIGDYIDGALQSCEGADFSNAVVFAFVPHNLRLELFNGLAEFEQTERDAVYPANTPYPVGKFKGITVMRWASREQLRHILVVDLSAAVKFEFGEVSVRVAVLTDSEIKERLTKDPKLTERYLRQLVNVEIKEQVALVVLNDRLVLRLAIPDEWFREATDSLGIRW